MNSKPITIIGDSNALFLIEDVKKMQGLYYSWNNEYKLGVHRVKDESKIGKLNIISINSFLAYHLNKEMFLKELEHFSEDSEFLVIMFGTNDVKAKMPKYNNHKEVVDHLVDIVKDACIKKNMIPIFVSPLVFPEHSFDFNKWMSFLYNRCKDEGFTEPINIHDFIKLDHSVFEWDEYRHLDGPGNSEILDHIKNKINYITLKQG